MALCEPVWRAPVAIESCANSMLDQQMLPETPAKADIYGDDQPDPCRILRTFEWPTPWTCAFYQVINGKKTITTFRLKDRLEPDDELEQVYIQTLERLS